MKKPPIVFQVLIALIILTIAATPFLVAECVLNSQAPHYYKIQRLNIEGKVDKTYVSKGRLPWARDHYIHFREYPSGQTVIISSNYTVEDLGTKLDTL